MDEKSLCGAEMRVINAKLEPIAERLYRALKLKPCACQYHWTKDEGYCVKVRCSGCQAIEDYEAVKDVISSTSVGV